MPTVTISPNGRWFLWRLPTAFLKQAKRHWIHNDSCSVGPKLAGNASDYV